MRRRKRRNRTRGAPFGHDHPSGRRQRHLIVVPDAAESVSCQLLAISRQTTRDPLPVESPFSPAWYLYATHGSLVFARISC